MEDEEYDMQKLIMKQLHMRQLMGLKTKGRFLEETRMFELDMHVTPSLASQTKVVSDRSLTLSV
jgi:dihydroneopterin aldolase